MIMVQSLHVVFPYLLKVIFDELPSIVEHKTITSKIVYLVVGLIVVKVINDLLWHFVHMINYLSLFIDVENDLPAKAQKKLLELPAQFHERENTGKKVAKVEKGIDRILWILHSLFWSFFPPLISMVLMVGTLIIIDWKIGTIFVSAVIPGILIYKYVYDKHIDKWDLWDAKKEKAVGLFVQSLVNVNTVQSFVQEENEITDHEDVRDKMRDIDRDVSLSMERWFSLISLTFNVGFLTTIIASLYFVVQGTTTMGTVVFLVTTGGALLGHIWELMNCYTNVIRRIYAVLRMKELFDEKSSISNRDESVVPSSFDGKFVFEEVEFAYPGKDRKVLNNFSVDIGGKQMVALVGKSGEGKTTIIKLLCRMYDVSTGSIYLDGVDIRNLDHTWYRKLFAIVKQDVEIFDGTIAQNIVYAHREASAEQIELALSAAHLKETLQDKSRFPDGLKTQVGERGVKLSGGERQRVGIARAYIALLSGAKVLVLDEATSNLDSEAEKAIQQMINDVRHKLDISIVAIAHRLSTISKADTIYVINDGQVSEKGDHRSLIKQNGLYSRLVELQQLGEIQ